MTPTIEIFTMTILILYRVLIKVCSKFSTAHHSRSLEEESDTLLSTQDKEILSILEELENKNDRSNIKSQSRLTGYFCSNTVFNLSRKVLSGTEIKILEKGLDYAPIQNKVNEPELRQDFDEFSRKMRLKWYFQNEAFKCFSETPSFRC